MTGCGLSTFAPPAISCHERLEERLMRLIRLGLEERLEEKLEERLEERLMRLIRLRLLRLRRQSRLET